MTLIWTVMAHGMECPCVQCWSHQWTRLAWNSTMGHCLFDQWHAIQALHQGMFQLSIGFVKIFVPFHLHSLVVLSSCIFWFLSSLGVIIWHSSYGEPSWKQSRYNEFETLLGYDILPIFPIRFNSFINFGNQILWLFLNVAPFFKKKLEGKWQTGNFFMGNGIHQMKVFQVPTPTAQILFEFTMYMASAVQRKKITFELPGSWATKTTFSKVRLG